MYYLVLRLNLASDLCARHLVFKEPPRLGEPDQNIEIARYVSSNFDRPALTATSRRLRPTQTSSGPTQTSSGPTQTSSGPTQASLGGYVRRDRPQGTLRPDNGEST